MGRASKIVKCVDCGREFPRKELNRNLRCRECSLPAMVRTINQIKDKSGPEYKKWKESMQNAVRRL